MLTSSRLEHTLPSCVPHLSPRALSSTAIDERPAENCRRGFLGAPAAAWGRGSPHRGPCPPARAGCFLKRGAGGADGGWRQSSGLKGRPPPLVRLCAGVTWSPLLFLLAPQRGPLVRALLASYCSQLPPPAGQSGLQSLVVSLYSVAQGDVCAGASTRVKGPRIPASPLGRRANSHAWSRPPQSSWE